MENNEEIFDFIAWCRRHWAWSKVVFGPPEERGPDGPVDHLYTEIKELDKAIQDPKDGWGDEDLEEVADIIHLAVDCALRAGHSIEELMKMLEFKQKKNHARDWPDWRTVPKGKAIEHIREEGEAPHSIHDQTDNPQKEVEEDPTRKLPGSFASIQAAILALPSVKEGSTTILVGYRSSIHNLNFNYHRLKMVTDLPPAFSEGPEGCTLIDPRPDPCEHCDNPDYDGGRPCPHCQPLIGRYDDRDE